MTEKKKVTMDEIVSLCKRRGFIYPASEIYDGFANTFDYGPLGVELKNNIKNEWWEKFVTSRDDIVGLDSAIIQNPKIWKASGHTEQFVDWMVECDKCKSRHRVEDILSENEYSIKNDKCEIFSQTKEGKICPSCGKEMDWEFLANSRSFNTMFKTFVGPIENSATITYLRPETAQGIFSNFKNVTQSTRVKVPFGIAQIGKAFRNEITPGNFIFRTLEFEQAEIEYFIEPDKETSNKEYKKWTDQSMAFFTDLGVNEKNLSIREHKKDELSHYSIGTSDIEYNFPFGVSELAGIAQRTDFDLKQHEKHSKEDLKYKEEGKEPYLPYVVEPSFGVDRALLTFLVDAYDKSDGSDGRAEGEVTLRLHPKLAPIKVAVLPLMKKEGMDEKAKEIAKTLKDQNIVTYYDESGSVGKRYRRQDEIGTPWCVTVDFDSLKDNDVTVRDRDTMEQERVKIAELPSYFKNKLK